MSPNALQHAYPQGAPVSPFDGRATVPPRYPDRLLRLPMVEDMTGMKKTTLYVLMKAAQFPGSVRLAGGRAVAWRESEVLAWIATRTKTGEGHE